MERIFWGDETREAWPDEHWLEGDVPLVSNDPTEVEQYAHAVRDHEDEKVIEQMDYAAAKALELTARAAEEHTFETVEEVIGFMRAVAVNIRHGA